MGRGPAPQPHRTRPNDDQRRQDELVKIAPDGEIHGPDLPEGVWPAQTLKWWTSWRTAAIAQSLTETDWDFLLDTAVLHARFWEGNVTVAGELRLRVAKYGATPEDRMRLKVQVGNPATAAPQPTPAATDTGRRGRLLSAVE